MKGKVALYMTERWKNQFEWYNKRSSRNRNFFHTLKIVEIVLAASIPFLSVLSNNDCFKTEDCFNIQFLVGLIGIIIAVSGSILLLLKSQDNWIRYRATAEMLKTEKYLFETKSGPYTELNAFQLFVEKIEIILADESSKWLQIMSNKNSSDNNNQVKN